MDKHTKAIIFMFGMSLLFYLAGFATGYLMKANHILLNSTAKEIARIYWLNSCLNKCVMQFNSMEKCKMVCEVD